MLANVN